MDFSRFTQANNPQKLFHEVLRLFVAAPRTAHIKQLIDDVAIPHQCTQMEINLGHISE